MKTYKRSRNKSRNKSRNNTRNKGRNKSYRAKKGCNSYTKHRKHIGGLPEWLRFGKRNIEPNNPNLIVTDYLRLVEKIKNGKNNFMDRGKNNKLLQIMAYNRLEYFNEIDNRIDAADIMLYNLEYLEDLIKKLKSEQIRIGPTIIKVNPPTIQEIHKADYLLDKIENKLDPKKAQIKKALMMNRKLNTIDNKLKPNKIPMNTIIEENNTNDLMYNDEKEFFQ